MKTFVYLLAVVIRFAVADEYWKYHDFTDDAVKQSFVNSLEISKRSCVSPIRSCKPSDVCCHANHYECKSDPRNPHASKCFPKGYVEYKKRSLEISKRSCVSPIRSCKPSDVCCHSNHYECKSDPRNPHASKCFPKGYAGKKREVLRSWNEVLYLQYIHANHPTIDVIQRFMSVNAIQETHVLKVSDFQRHTPVHMMIIWMFNDVCSSIH